MQRILRILQRFLLTYTMLTIGAGIGALAVMIFLAPNDIAPGGVSGIAVISNRVLGTPIGLLVFILNIPIQILAWRLLP
ncbi:MAG: YitT family protein, partial [Chloroflexota bacterium]